MGRRAMKRNTEVTIDFKDSNEDYSFLRCNGVHPKTTLKMLAKAYQGKKGLGGETE